MSDDLDRAVEDLLHRSSEPSAPSREFERRLRAELFPEDVRNDAVEGVRELHHADIGVERTAPARSLRTGRRTAALAVAASLVLLGGLVWFGSGGSGDTDLLSDLEPTTTSGPTTTTASLDGSADLAAAQEACTTFAAESFADRPRLQVVGPNNAAHLNTDAEILSAVARLSSSFESLRNGLDASNVGGPDFDREAARVEARLAAVERRAGAGQTSNALVELSKVEELLIAVDTALTVQGVPQCF